MNEVITKVFLECARAIDASELITRVSSTDKDTNLKLWRIRASRLRCFTDREYARLQTFPDTWVFHGEVDRKVKIGRSEEMVEALQEVGSKPIFSVLKGQGHGIQKVYSDQNIYKWLHY